MKKIEAVIRHYKLDAVKDALTTAGILGMTVSEVRGCGQQRGHLELARRTENQVDLLPKLLIEVVATDEDLELAVSAILQASRTGKVGDGKIFVRDLVDVIRIRTGETGDSAV